jgi:bifunctional UDP-N-acetylglucosamine pyrophosphorylase/glucosamine-1-phosphate N-acetyltransferase
MWWRELEEQERRLSALTEVVGRSSIDPAADVADSAVIDTSSGPVEIGPRTQICAGARICGPAVIGADCMVGNLALVRGPVVVGDRSRIGYATEIKNAIIAQDVSIGPQCFVADSKLDAGAYLGAQVRTSNHRLDGQSIAVMIDGERVDTGRTKLGCLIGAGSALGIQAIVLPGRVVAPGSTFGPRITIERNLPAGRYRLAQQLETF